VDTDSGAYDVRFRISGGGRHLMRFDAIRKDIILFDMALDQKWDLR
jgi:hypothetical protein